MWTVYNIDVHTACTTVHVIFEMLSCLAVNVLCLSVVDVSFCVALYCSSGVVVCEYTMYDNDNDNN